MRYALFILSLLELLLGCAQEVPMSKRDLEFARKDLELDREKYKTFVGSNKRKEIEQRIEDHNYKWYIDLDSQEEQPKAASIDEEDRINEFNRWFEKQLNEAQQPVQKK